MNTIKTNENGIYNNDSKETITYTRDEILKYYLDNKLDIYNGNENKNDTALNKDKEYFTSICNNNPKELAILLPENNIVSNILFYYDIIRKIKEAELILSIFQVVA